MLDEVKEYRSILMKRLLIMMKICWKIHGRWLYYRGRNQPLRAAMDMAIIPMIAGSS
jgi:hypothetical protein